MPKAAPLHLLTAIEIHRALQSLSRVLFMTTEALARSILGVLNEAQITYRIINLAWSNHSRSTPFFTSNVFPMRVGHPSEWATFPHQHACAATTRNVSTTESAQDLY
jgi:hypothetical protein